MMCEYDCAFESDPSGALQHAHFHPCDAYVLDYWMPEWSGPLLCREIRKRDPHCTVIVCGDAADVTGENRAFRAGASAYLGKLDKQALLSRLFALIASGDADSTRAEGNAGRVLGKEMKRCIGIFRAGTPAEAADELERAVRAPTFRAYIDGGGTRARFERWWPERFESQRLATAG